MLIAHDARATVNAAKTASTPMTGRVPGVIAILKGSRCVVGGGKRRDDGEEVAWGMWCLNESAG